MAVTAAALSSTGSHPWTFADLALAAVIVVMFHATANLINTYFDYRSGVDLAAGAEADDRTLVDKKLAPAQVGALGALAFVLGAIASAFALWTRSSDLFSLISTGALLALFYTAAPFSLKYHGLGEAAIFLCFGPLLVEATAVLLTGTSLWSLRLLSVAFGFSSVAILHVNNTRDVKADKAAGAFTWAQSASFQTCRRLYVCLLLASLVTGILGMAAVHLPASEHSKTAALDRAMALYTCATKGGCFSEERLLSLAFGAAGALMTLPWALSLFRRFRQENLGTMPQETAQWGLLLGAALSLGFVPPRVIGRSMVVILFYLGAINSFLKWEHSVALVFDKLNLLLPVSRPLAAAALVIGCVTQLMGSLMIIFGVYVREAALLLAVYLCVITISVHDFWNAGREWDDHELVTPAEVQRVTSDRKQPPEPGRGPASRVRRRRSSRSSLKRDHEPVGESVAKSDEMSLAPVYALPGGGGRVATFMEAFDNEFVHFFKNVGILGGLVLLAIQEV